MNYIQELKAEHTKIQATRIAAYAALNPKTIEDLILLMYHNNMRVAQRAAWPVCILGKKHPQLIEAHIQKLINGIENTAHPAVPRNCLRVLDTFIIPEAFHSIIIDKCFAMLQNNENPIAVRAFFIQLIINVAHLYPEIAFELQQLLEPSISYQSAGMRSKYAHLQRVIGKL
jgi:hypothetical protein